MFSLHLNVNFKNLPFFCASRIIIITIIITYPIEILITILFFEQVFLIYYYLNFEALITSLHKRMRKMSDQFNTICIIEKNNLRI